MPSYEYIRMSLTKRKTGPLLEILDEPITREGFLRKSLRNRVEFIHRRKKYVYIPRYNIDNMIVGVVGRDSNEIVSDSLENNFAPKKIKIGHIANFVINLKSGDYEQVCAVEIKNRVGSPIRVLQSLFLEIEKNSSLYFASFAYLSNKRDFWDIVKKHEGEIDKVIFNFSAPNMFGGRDVFNKSLRELRDSNNVQKSTMSFVSEKGAINFEGDGMKQMVCTALDGAGDARLKVGKKNVFTSSNKRKVSDIDDDTTILQSSEYKIRNLLRKLFSK